MCVVPRSAGAGKDERRLAAGDPLAAVAAVGVTAGHDGLSKSGDGEWQVAGGSVSRKMEDVDEVNKLVQSRTGGNGQWGWVVAVVAEVRSRVISDRRFVSGKLVQLVELALALALARERKQCAVCAV